MILRRAWKLQSRFALVDEALRLWEMIRLGQRHTDMVISERTMPANFDGPDFLRTGAAPNAYR
jgi:hypothetical protein